MGTKTVQALNVTLSTFANCNVCMHAKNPAST